MKMGGKPYQCLGVTVRDAHCVAIELNAGQVTDFAGTRGPVSIAAEAIFIMREVAAEFERPALMFSGGKDSICLLRLAEKAFRPSEFPMPLLNVDTGHHFPELNEFRDRRAAELGARLIVRIQLKEFALFFDENESKDKERS